MGFAELSSLESQLRTLEGNLKSYKDQLAKLKRRKSKVEDIIRDMQSVCNNKSGDVNGFINNIINSVESAIRGVINPTKGIASSYKEKGIDSDGNMNSAYSQMKSELNDINRKIDELNSKISSTQGRIEDCEGQIRSQKYRIANGYRNKYYTANSKFEAAKKAYQSNPSDAHLKQEYDKARRNRDQAKRDYNKYSGWL